MRIYAPKHNVKNFEPIQTPAGFCLEITTKTHQKFRDYGSKITSDNGYLKPSTASEMIRTYKARGWSSLKLTGSQEYKDELTIQAVLQDVSTDHVLSEKAYKRLVDTQNKFKKERKQPIFYKSFEM
ncbi:LPD7 domain-containing protein [Parasaccharibacter apium]|uniref:LPD7 domain-containing protein n=1 Tax=Parasaccharibacter apium TaxID=1510841 RepID=UPI0012667BE6|nr:LPD7 domain-containing protein [Parasaccharibacter apium]